MKVYTLTAWLKKNKPQVYHEDSVSVVTHLQEDLNYEKC